MSSISISDPAVTPDSQSIVSRQRKDGSSKANSSIATDNNPGNRKHSEKENKLPAVYQSKNIVSASDILSQKYPVEFSSDYYEKSLKELYYVFLGIGTYLFLVYIGWAAVKEINFTESGDFVYNAGLVGGILMLIALSYSAFKRMKFFKRHATPETWYYLHIACGAVGAYLVILHSTFNLGSTNSTVAFFCMLIIIISGALGRYMYTLSSIILHRQYAEIKQLEPDLFESLNRYDCKNSDRVRNRLSKFSLHCLNPPKGVIRFFTRTVSVTYYGWYFYITSARDLRKIINRTSKQFGFSKKDRTVLRKAKIRALRHYMRRIIRMGYMSLVEHLFHKWRMLHVPLLYILTISAIVHVVVIHMY